MLSFLLKHAARLLTPRSPLWPAKEREHRRREPLCQWCGGAEDIQVHHVVPFHEDKTLELVDSNLVTLCMAPLSRCHLIQGHRGSWIDWDPDVRSRCDEHRRAIHGGG